MTMPTTETLIRFFAFILRSLAWIWLLRNACMSFESFNPSYPIFFFKQVLLSPLILLLAGYWIHYRAPKIAMKLEAKKST